MNVLCFMCIEQNPLMEQYIVYGGFEIGNEGESEDNQILVSVELETAKVEYIATLAENMQEIIHGLSIVSESIFE